VEERLARRLEPTAIERLEEEVLANGESLAKSILDWLRWSTEWKLDGVEPLAEALRKATVDLVDPNARVGAQAKAARAALTEIYGDVKWVSEVFDKGFHSTVECLPAKRRAPRLPF